MSKKSPLEWLARLLAGLYITVSLLAPVPVRAQDNTDSTSPGAELDTPQVQILPGPKKYSVEFFKSLAKLIASQNPNPAARYYRITSGSFDIRSKVYTLGLAGYTSDQEGVTLDQAAALVTAEVHWDNGRLAGTVAPLQITAPVRAETFGVDALGYQVNTIEMIFPWKPGTRMEYGLNKIHEAGFSSVLPGSNWHAVDFFTDGDEEAGHAPFEVYAADGGVAEYVCIDDHNMAVWVGAYLYTHLVIDSGIIQGSTTFAQGDKIGDIVEGPIPTDTCGWAPGQAEGWGHIHWVFQGNTLEADGCSLSIVSQIWQCGQDHYDSGQWVPATGTTMPPGVDPPPPSNGVANFWDYVLGSATWVIDNIILRVFPDHKSANLATYVVNFAAWFLQLIYYIVIVFDLTMPLIMIGIVLGLEPIRIVVKLIALVKRVIGFVIPFLG